MTSPASQLVESSLLALRERKRHLDAVTLLSAAMVFGSVAAPWFLRILDVDLGPAAWVSFSYAAAYLVASILTDDLQGQRAIKLAMVLLHLSFPVFLAVLWHALGGVDFPMFLFAFFLPVATSGALLARWLTYTEAGLGVVLVTGMALGQSQSLRWYMGQVGLDAGWFGSLFPSEALVRPTTFPYLSGEPSFLVSLLSVFAVLLFLEAFATQAVTRVVLRLGDRLAASVGHFEEVRSLFQAILQTQPEPGIVVYADTGQIVHASDSFLQRMLLKPDELVGRSVFDLVSFGQPERIRPLLGKGQQEVPFCTYQIGGETRIANVSVYTVEHASTTYAYVGFKDLTEQYYLNAAFDAIEEPVLVVSADGQLRYSNRAAEDVFGALYFGLDVATLLVGQGLEAGWWAMPRTEERAVTIGGRSYLASCIAAPLPGETQGAIIVTLTRREPVVASSDLLDPLTGTPNERYLELVLPQYRELFGGAGRLCLAVIQLDEREAIEAGQGAAGFQAALTGLARAIRMEVGARDVLARTGEDEFALLLPEVNLPEANMVIDRVYRRLDRQPMVHNDVKRVLGFSAGLVTVARGESPDLVLKRARGLALSARRRGKGLCVSQA